MTGCALDSMPTYDPNAIRKFGTVIAVEEIKTEAPFQNDSMMIPVAGALVPIQLGSPQRAGSDFRYQVKTADGQTIPVVSKFGGFTVYECVTLFLSQTLPPRIARGGSCL